MKSLHVVALLAAMCAGSAPAHDFRAGDIVIDQPYALVGGTSVYFRTSRNKGSQPVRLLGARGATARRIELLHEGRQESLELAPGAEVRVRHDGPWRLELRELKMPLRPGDTVAVTLRFEHAGEVTVAADVVDATARHPH
jgi:periplasmic copper chaperone A